MGGQKGREINGCIDSGPGAGTELPFVVGHQFVIRMMIFLILFSFLTGGVWLMPASGAGRKYPVSLPPASIDMCTCRFLKEIRELVLPALSI